MSEEGPKHKRLSFPKLVEIYGDASQNASNPNFVEDHIEFEKSKQLQISEDDVKTASINMLNRFHRSKEATKKSISKRTVRIGNLTEQEAFEEARQASEEAK